MRGNSTGIRSPFDFTEKDLDALIGRFPPALRNHCRRVAVCASVMAEHAEDSTKGLYRDTGTNLSFLAYLTGTLHDVGKLLLPAFGASEDDYFRHSAMGAEFLDKHKESLFDRQVEAPVVIDAVRRHHERPDGLGFPDGIYASAISLPAAVCSLADALDYALFNENDPAVALRGIKAQSGKAFCERAVLCLERAWPRLEREYTGWKHMYSV